MSGQKGLVLELEKGLAVVLTPDGQYRRIAAGREWELGQEVQFEATVLALPQRRRLNAAWLVAAVVLLALLVPGTLSVRSLLSRPALAAYVAVDINPSLELQVDAGGKVLAAQAVNDDAVPLLQVLSLKGLPLDQAVRAITEKAVAAGYLSQSNDNMVLITVTPKASGADVPQAVQQQVAASRQAAATVLNQRGLKNDVEALSAPAEVRDAAKSQGLPTGKLFVASEAARQGTVIDRDTLKNQPLTKAFEKNGNREALQKALERIKASKDKDALLKAVDDFVGEMSKEGQGGQSGPGGPGGKAGSPKDGGEARDAAGKGQPQTGSKDNADMSGGAKPGNDPSSDKGNGKDDLGNDARKGGSSGDSRLNPGSTPPSREHDGKDERKRNGGKTKPTTQGSPPDPQSGSWPADPRWAKQFKDLWNRLFGGSAVQDHPETANGESVGERGD